MSDQRNGIYVIQKSSVVVGVGLTKV